MCLCLPPTLTPTIHSQMSMQSLDLSVPVAYQSLASMPLSIFVILSTSASTAKHYIWFQLAVCGVECPISNFQGSVQREWCTRLSSHCAYHITTVSQHLSTPTKYSVQHCSGSHAHYATGQGQQLSDQGIHYYFTRCVGLPLVQKVHLHTV